MNPAVSVIIPCYNAASWIRDALLSVAEQGGDATETIVVDDGSTDGSVAIIEKEFPSVRLEKTKNRGPSRARNLGTKISRGEYIQYCDADDMLAPGKLKIQLEALRRGAGDVAYGSWQKLRKAKDGAYIHAETVAKEIGEPEIDLFTYFWCPPAVYLFRRSIVERVGGWNERLPVIQDARFALDCALQGGRFIRCPGIMAYYRVHASDSVSSRDPVAFLRDCFTNATEVEAWWKAHGGVHRKRKGALLEVYGYIARQSFERDPGIFEAAHASLVRIDPRYVPQSPKRLAFVSRLIGYRRAEYVGSFYRRMKKHVRIHRKRQ